MFKVRPIRTCAKFEPVKESEAQKPSVELITELVKVELQELCFYVMVRVQYAPFGIADGNVHPRQNFPDTLFVIRNYGMVGGCHSVLFKSGITAEPVRGHIGVSVRPRLYLARDGGSLKIADDQHLYMPDSLGVLYFLAGGVADRLLSAMTRTEVLRWLPRPRFSGQSFWSSGVSVEKKPSSTSISP